MKILCFTTSYRRPYYIYNIINNILNQSYHNIEYCVNINLDNLLDKELYSSILEDFTQDKRLKIIYNKNNDQQINYVRAINGFDHCDYDLFFKIDDDDIYRKDYIKKSIELFNSHSCDVMSYVSNININNNVLKDKPVTNIGNWAQDAKSEIQFGMPSSFVFNKKACDIIRNIDLKTSKKIHRFEDGAWKELWRKNQLKSTIIDDENLFIYNIHKNNVSSTFLLDKDLDNINLIDNQHVTIAYCEHKNWKSYIYLNKRNNRIYNITNDDHGSYSISENKLIIKWDNWGKEEFIKVFISDILYKYKSI